MKIVPKNNYVSFDGISSNVMRKLNVDIWIDREDVCIGCHNDNCEVKNGGKHFLFVK